MYRNHFGFREPPFRLTPDPRCVWRGTQYTDAIAALVAAVTRRRGVATLIAEAGTGKTTLVRLLLEELPPEVRTVLVLHPTVSFDETLDHVLLDLGIPVEGASAGERMARLHEVLRERNHDGGTVAVCIDEAQSLDVAFLAELPTLLDLRCDDGSPALQLLLVGQPELDDVLAAPALAALRERVAVSVRLPAVDAADVGAYVAARLAHAGAPDANLFEPSAIDAVARLANGIPRTINLLCDAALVAAFADGAPRVTAGMVQEAWRELAVAGPPTDDGVPAPSPPHDAGPACDAPLLLPTGERAGPPWPPVRPRSFVRRAALASAGVAALFAGLVAWRELHAPPTEAIALRMQTVSTVAVPPPADAPPPAVGDVERDAAAAAGDDTPPPPAQPPPSAAEALAAVDQVRAALEARDLDRLVRCFAEEPPAPTVTAWRRIIEEAADVAWTQPRAVVAPERGETSLEAPFVVAWHTTNGTAHTLHGTGVWRVARRDGEVRVVSVAWEPAERKH